MSNLISPLFYTDDITLVCPSNQTREAIPGVTFHQLTFPNPVVLPEGADVTFRQSPRYFETGLTRVTFFGTDPFGAEYSCHLYVNLAGNTHYIRCIALKRHQLPGFLNVIKWYCPKCEVPKVLPLMGGWDLSLNVSPQMLHGSNMSKERHCTYYFGICTQFHKDRASYVHHLQYQWEEVRTSTIPTDVCVYLISIVFLCHFILFIFSKRQHTSISNLSQ